MAASDPPSCLKTPRDGRQAPIRASKGAGGDPGGKGSGLTQEAGREGRRAAGFTLSAMRSQ